MFVSTNVFDVFEMCRTIKMSSIQLHKQCQHIMLVDCYSGCLHHLNKQIERRNHECYAAASLNISYASSEERQQHSFLSQDADSSQRQQPISCLAVHGLPIPHQLGKAVDPVYYVLGNRLIRFFVNSTQGNSTVWKQ